MKDRRAVPSEIRAALYARVSSERQAEKDLSIPAQLKALRQHAGKQGWRVVEQFVDEAESARTAARPEFQRMIALSKQKPPAFTAILVWKLSRFARNREDSILYKAMLRKHGVQLVSINEPIDDSPAGRMLEGMIEVVDEFYSANLSVDTVRGMNENASRGFLNGGRSPYGYRRVRVKVGEAEKSKHEPDPAEAPLIKRIFEMALGGMGVKEIAKKLNAEGAKTREGNRWANTVLYYMLTNETYTGVTVFNAYRYWDAKGAGEQKAIRVEGTHPPLVSKADFEAVRRLFKARSPKIIHPTTRASDYPLSGLAYCGAGVEAQLRTLNARLDKLYVALETGHVDMADIGPRIKALRQEIEAAEEQKRDILAQESSPLKVSGAEVRRCVEDLRELLADGTIMERKSWLRTWVKRISVDKKRGGTIEYSLPLARNARGLPTVGGLKAQVLSTVQIGCPIRIRTTLNGRCLNLN